MTERRYNEAEVGAIFERAAEAPSSASPVSSAIDGMTLVQLQEIGTEVGISADAIALAATEVDQPIPVALRTFLGLPLGAARTVQLQRALTDTEWELLVSELRETFNAPGALTGHGSLRQWTNGNLQVLFERTASGHQLRLRTDKRDAAANMSVGIAILLGSALALGAAVVFGAVDDKGMMASLVVAGSVGATIVAAIALPLRRWARTRQQQFDAIASRVALTTKALPPGSEK